MNIEVVRSGSIVYMHMENVNGFSFTFGAPKGYYAHFGRANAGSSCLSMRR